MTDSSPSPLKARSDHQPKQRLGQSRNGMYAPQIRALTQSFEHFRRTRQHERRRIEYEDHRLPYHDKPKRDEQTAYCNHRRLPPRIIVPCTNMDRPSIVTAIQE